MIWFRDVSDEVNKIVSLENEKKAAVLQNQQLEDIIDNLPYPAWLRDDNLNIVLINNKSKQ